MGCGAAALGRSVWIMWSYERRLQFPVNIKEPNAKLAQAIISQFGGPDGELAASMRYLSQKFATPYKEVAGLLNDIGASVTKLRILGFQCTPEGDPSGVYAFSIISIERISVW